MSSLTEKLCAAQSPKNYIGDVECRRSTPMELLVARKSDLEQRLSDVKEAIEALEANPTITDVLSKLSKLNINY